ncbi:hypothetical protein MJL48_32705, partial [Salmonella enterica subsp. enterica serovar Kentucky]|nr:hypothetical protein [Salmonella enterica subsp. enterica serovar Kentucky]
LPLICDWPNRPKQKVCYETGKPAQTEYNVVEFAADNTARVVLMPMVGNVPDYHATLTHYADLADNKTSAALAPVYPGLFMLGALG